MPAFKGSPETYIYIYICIKRQRERGREREKEREMDSDGYINIYIYIHIYTYIYIHVHILGHLAFLFFCSYTWSGRCALPGLKKKYNIKTGNVIKTTKFPPDECEKG